MPTKNKVCCSTFLTGKAKSNLPNQARSVHTLPGKIDAHGMTMHLGNEERRYQNRATDAVLMTLFSNTTLFMQNDGHAPSGQRTMSHLNVILTPIAVI